MELRIYVNPVLREQLIIDARKGVYDGHEIGYINVGGFGTYADRDGDEKPWICFEEARKRGEGLPGMSRVFVGETQEVLKELHEEGSLGEKGIVGWSHTHPFYNGHSVFSEIDIRTQKALDNGGKCAALVGSPDDVAAYVLDVNGRPQRVIYCLGGPEEC